MTNEQLLQLIKDDQALGELLLKAQISTSLGGLVAPQQAREFIDMSVEQTAPLRRMRVVTGIVRSYELHDISLGEPVLRPAVEGTAPDASDVSAPTITQRVLQPRPVRADFDVTFDMIRQNIEGEGLNATLNRLFSKQFGKDIVYVAFNGDTAYDPTDTTPKGKATRALDGLLKQLGADADVHVYTIPSTPIYSGSNGVFSSMIKLLPKDYRDDRSALAFFVSQNVLDAYEDEIADRQTTTADAVMFGSADVSRYKRIEIVPVYGLPDNKIILTVQRNLVVGFGRDMQVGMDVYNRKGVVEVTIRTDVDVSYIRGDAVVLGT